jgi:hypothetical protein
MKVAGIPTDSKAFGILNRITFMMVMALMDAKWLMQVPPAAIKKIRHETARFFTPGKVAEHPKTPEELRKRILATTMRDFKVDKIQGPGFEHLRELVMKGTKVQGWFVQAWCTVPDPMELVKRVCSGEINGSNVTTMYSDEDSYVKQFLKISNVFRYQARKDVSEQNKKFAMDKIRMTKKVGDQIEASLLTDKCATEVAKKWVDHKVNHNDVIDQLWKRTKKDVDGKYVSLSVVNILLRAISVDTYIQLANTLGMSVGLEKIHEGNFESFPKLKAPIAKYLRDKKTDSDWNTKINELKKAWSGKQVEDLSTRNRGGNNQSDDGKPGAKPNDWKTQRNRRSRDTGKPQQQQAGGRAGGQQQQQAQPSGRQAGAGGPGKGRQNDANKPDSDTGNNRPRYPSRVDPCNARDKCRNYNSGGCNYYHPGSQRNRDGKFVPREGDSGRGTDGSRTWDRQRNDQGATPGQQSGWGPGGQRDGQQQQGAYGPPAFGGWGPYGPYGFPPGGMGYPGGYPPLPQRGY